MRLWCCEKQEKKQEKDVASVFDDFIASLIAAPLLTSLLTCLSGLTTGSLMYATLPIDATHTAEWEKYAGTVQNYCLTSLRRGGDEGSDEGGWCCPWLAFSRLHRWPRSRLASQV